MYQYIRISTTYTTHHKIIKLEQILGVGAVLAHLHLLTKTALYRPDGKFTNCDWEDIEILAGWEGDPGALTEALIELHLLDNDENGILSIHNWEKWNGEIVRDRHKTWLQKLRDQWNTIRHEMTPRILRRDNYQCVYCGSKRRLSVDHIMPLARGGGHEETNLTTACRSCNSSKGAKTIEEWNKR